MGLFGKTDPSGSARAIALVVSAEAPPQGAPSFGQEAQGIIRVLVDRRQLTATARYSDKHWLVRGMEVPVFLDPARPDTFAVDWDAVGDMASRASANDPALADPVGAAQRVAQALGVPLGDLRVTSPVQLREALTKAAAAPAPTGRVRAVILVSTVRGRYSGSDAHGNNTSLTLHRSSEAVLSVNVPGRAPYAVFTPKFKIPHGRGLHFGPLPGLVTATDPHDVEILWDEAPTLTDMVNNRMAESAQRTNEQIAALTDQFQAATQQAVQQYAAGRQAATPQHPTADPVPGQPAPGYPMPGASSISPQMRNARQQPPHVIAVCRQPRPAPDDDRPVPHHGHRDHAGGAGTLSCDAGPRPSGEAIAIQLASGR